MGRETEWMMDKLGFLVHLEGDDLVLTVDQEFIDTCGTGKWGPIVRKRYPGPYRRLILDMSGCKIIQSTVFAEMLHIRDLYADAASEGVFLKNPSQRLLTVLDIMQIRPLFHIL